MTTYIKKPEYIIAHQFDWTKSWAMNILKECTELLSLGSSYNNNNDELYNWRVETRPDLSPPYSWTIVNKWDYICKWKLYYFVLPEKEFKQIYDIYISSQS